MAAVKFQDVVARANAIKDPKLKGEARAILLRMVKEGGAQPSGEGDGDE